MPTTPTTYDILVKIVRLTKHPLFHEQSELPAWNDLIALAKEVIFDEQQKLR